MCTDGSQNGGGASGQVQLVIDHVRVSKTRTRLTARLAADLVHQDEINVSNATARARFAEEVAERTGLDQAEVEEYLLGIAAELAELYGNDENKGTGPLSYRLVHDHEDPEQRGLYFGPMQLTNATLVVIEDVRVDDDVESRREFKLLATFDGTTSEFTISAGNFANNTGLPEAIYAAVGPKVRILCKPYVLRTAISAVSDPVARRVTTNFGWNKEGDAFLTPGVRIDANGFHPSSPSDQVRVDLADEQCARHLDLAAPKPYELARLKKHLVGSFLPLSVRRVTYTLVAAAALAVLIRFVKGMNRPGIWLVGMTGGGKSFLARLVANFFGDFPLELGDRLGSWSSTANFIQRQGFFFKDALYLVDDYKPDVVAYRDVVKVLQNYADGSARGRLNSDATTNVSRPIRGLLVSTGEDVPEHGASPVARNVIVAVPSLVKDVKRGSRCLRRCGRYRALMAAFIHYLIVNNRAAGFAKRVDAERGFFYAGIEGEQNDIRIAGNFALLMAAFLEFAAFLGNDWPDRNQESEAFRTDLLAVRDEMLAAVRRQQASEVFLSALKALVTSGQAQIRNWSPDHGGAKVENKPVVGRNVAVSHPEQTHTFDIVTQLALAAVNDLLRRQAKTPLAVTEKTLIHQLAADGKLLDKNNQPIAPETGGDHTWAAKVDGATKNVFRIRAVELTGEPATGTPNPSGGTATSPGAQPAAGPVTSPGGQPATGAVSNPGAQPAGGTP